MMENSNEVIVAIATASGRGGVGIVRLSGDNLDGYMEAILGQKIGSRKAVYSAFLDHSGNPIDQGVAVYYPAPNSFTGESVLELQGHGGTIILDALVGRCLQLGARLARPGEFSERAFLNDKMDLTQAEAVADLINAGSIEAARSAVLSMQGEFSKLVAELVEKLILVRMYVEAAIDFPEEEIDFLKDKVLFQKLDDLSEDLQAVLEKAARGARLNDGLKLVLAGKPNVGKSSLLNAFAHRDVAIVTPVAGTTRDVLRETVTYQGLTLNFVDTAGLRSTDDEIEAEGVRRARREINSADYVVLVVDSYDDADADVDTTALYTEFFDEKEGVSQKLVVLRNKADLSGITPGIVDGDVPTFAVSAKEQSGFDPFFDFFCAESGLTDQSEGVFSARRRHLIALEKALQLVKSGTLQLRQAGAGELLAEDLRQAQTTLSEITGEFTSDDLLGRIFSSFCIGK
jgi:tRNA modification GTPase